MILSIRTKLTLAFAFVCIFLILLTGVLGKALLESHFSEYVLQKQEDKNKEIVSLINKQYSKENGWNLIQIEDIGIRALEEGLIVKITDNINNVVWDATKHNSGLCQQMIAHMQENMMSRYSNWKGEFTVKDYPLSSDFLEVGKAEIGYYGPFYFNDADLNFINALNTALVWVTGFALVFSIFIGAFLSKRISSSIVNVTNGAQMIERGNYSFRSEEKSTTREIRDLVMMINSLAHTLEKQELFRKRLTGDVAHELRTPLSTLQSHIEAMIDGIWNPSKERLNSCHEEIVRLNKMVDDLHLLAKFEGENLIINKTNFNIFELTSNIILNFEGQFRSKGVQILLNGTSQEIYGDRDKISQVLINLISNALKYTPEGGAVEVNLGLNKDYFEIVVKDSGVGISGDDLPYIFERFYRADRSRNRMTGGAGIGLTIVKAIVEAHNGTIDVDSEVGFGSVFIVKLPVS